MYGTRHVARRGVQVPKLRPGLDEAILTVNTSTIGLLTGAVTAAWAIPVGVVSAGLLGLLVGSGRQGALIGAGLGSAYALFMGTTAAQKVHQAKQLLAEGKFQQSHFYKAPISLEEWNKKVAAGEGVLFQ